MTDTRFATLMLALAAMLISVTVRGQEGLAEYRTYWEAKDASFRNPDTSPLEPGDLAAFDSVPRFPFNSAYRVVAQWEPMAGVKPQSIETTTEAKRRMQKAGQLVFELEGKSLSLPVYRDLTMARMQAEEPGYFLPFTDLTNGEKTYGGGRYLDMEGLGLDPAEVVLDFNLSYNPYCVYSPKFSCPIPPLENHLPVRIVAGAAMK